jgi:hypothetical protein
VGLGGRGEQEPRALLLGQPESLVGAERAHLQGLDGQLEVVDRGGGTREVQHVVERPAHHDVVGDVVLDEEEAGVADVGDVVGRTGEEVVHADDLAPVGEQEIAEMGANEAGPAGHEDAHRPDPQPASTGLRPIE